MRLSLILTPVILTFTLQSFSAQDTGCTAVDNKNNFTSWEGTLHSPGFGRTPFYPTGENCNWTIVIPKVLLSSTFIKFELTFLQFDVGGTDSICAESGDNLQIMGLRPGKSEVVCRSENLTYEYSNIRSEFTRELKLKFVSDNKTSEGERGFSVRYKFPEHPCAKCLDGESCDQSKPPDQMCVNPCTNYICNHGICLINTTTGLPYCKCNKCWYSERCLALYTCNGGECLDNSEHNNKVKCNCTEGIKEDICDNDPCQPNPCQNDGTCTRDDNSPFYKCTCLPHYTGKRCENINYCSSNPCQHGGVCENLKDRFECTCTSLYRGRICDQPNDGTYCEEGKDAYHGSQIFWRGKRMGEKDEQSCPFAQGTAVRYCSEMKESNGSYAYWEVPDLSQCVSPQFREILNHAKNLSEQTSVTPDALLQLTHTISKAINNGSLNNGTDQRIYAGDLGAATTTVQTVGKLVGKTESSSSDLHDLSQGYGTAVGHIINPKASAIWRFSRMGYLEKRITTILGSMETFSSNIAARTSYLMSHEKRRSTNVATQRSREYNISLDTLDPYIHLYSAKFLSVSTLLEETNAKITAPSPTHNVTAFLNSDIISSKILNVPEDSFNDLKKPVVLTFTVQDTTLPRILKRSCVFMNMSATTRKDQWITEGCHMDMSASNLTHTVCICNHLTNFAVLMDVYGIENTIDDFNSKILTYFSYIGGALSVLGCVIAIIVFEFFRLKNERIRVHEQLAATIILVQLFFLAGIDRTENRRVCKAVAICLHYFLLAMFSWMLVEGIHLYLALVKVFKSNSHMKKYVTIGWGAPLVIVGISAGIFHDYYGSGSVCWLPRNVLLVAFIPPVGLVVVINTVVLLIVMRIMMKSLSKRSKVSVEDRSSLRIGIKAAAVLLPLLGLTWTFGFLSITSKETLIFTYLFTFFNSTQGVFFFVFHCLLSVDVQNAFERRSRRRSQMRLTETSSSRGPRRESEYDSSIYNYSKTSVKTTLTDTSGTLDNHRRIHSGPGTYNSMNRPQSVTFDDDVFLPPRNNDSVITRHNNRNVMVNPIPRHHKTYFNSVAAGSADYELTSTPDMNNIHRASTNRESIRSNDNYILYNGKDTSLTHGHDECPVIDKSQLYTTVQK